VRDRVRVRVRVRASAAHRGEARGLLLLGLRHRLGLCGLEALLLAAAVARLAGRPRAQRVVGEARARRDILAHLVMVRVRVSVRVRVRVSVRVTVRVRP
jgi:hypothetical protein